MTTGVQPSDEAHTERLSVPAERSPESGSPSVNGKVRGANRSAAGPTESTESDDSVDAFDPTESNAFGGTARQRKAKQRAAERAAAKVKENTKEKKGSFWKELPILILIALVLTFLIQTFIARVYSIPSGSMEQTLHGCDGCTGDRILVDELVYDFHDPQPGDVVVFKGPDGWAHSEFQFTGSSNVFVHWVRQFGAAIGIGKPDEYDLVKRVIAVGGQTVSCCDAQHRVLVNGKPLNEPYVYWQPGLGGPTDPKQEFKPVTIPNGYIWVMGDNRANSDDSRFQNGGGINGIVPVKNVIGKARVIIYPISRWNGISDTNPQQQAQALPSPWQTSPVAPTGMGLLLAGPTLLAGRKLRRTRFGFRRRRRRKDSG